MMRSITRMSDGLLGSLLKTVDAGAFVPNVGDRCGTGIRRKCRALRLAAASASVLAGVLAIGAPAGAATHNDVSHGAAAPHHGVVVLPGRGVSRVSPQTFPAGYSLLRNYHDGLCLTVTGAVGSSVVVAGCNFSGSNHAQDWQILTYTTINGVVWTRIHNFHTGGCLDDEDTAIITRACNGSNNQLWAIVVGDVAEGLLNRHANKVLDANTAHQTYVDPWTDNHSQEWYNVG
jgi:hypothetical protein